MQVVSGQVLGVVTDEGSATGTVLTGTPMQPMQIAQPMQQPVNPLSNFPTALGNAAGLPPSPLVLGPPIPIKKHGSLNDGIKTGFHTNSPRVRHKFLSPAMDFVTTEADFDRGVNVIEAEQGDALAPLLSGGSQLMDLELDVEGRLDDMRKVIKKNCYCITGCILSGVCTLCGLHIVATSLRESLIAMLFARYAALLPTVAASRCSEPRFCMLNLATQGCSTRST